MFEKRLEALTIIKTLEEQLKPLRRVLFILLRVLILGDVRVPAQRSLQNRRMCTEDSFVDVESSVAVLEDQVARDAVTSP